MQAIPPVKPYLYPTTAKGAGPSLRADCPVRSNVRHLLSAGLIPVAQGYACQNNAEKATSNRIAGTVCLLRGRKLYRRKVSIRSRSV